MPEPEDPFSPAAAPDAPENRGLPALTPDVVEQEKGVEIDNIVPTEGYAKLPVVGLGGSAGGLAALQAFFGAMAPESGMAFVVIMHLSPEHDSILAEVLQHSTSMPVRQVRDRIRVEANHVYVIPPAKHLSIADGHLVLSELARARPGKHVAVDLFFRTLADTHGPHAAAIVLSGADGDGAIGIKRIKERGGLTVAQDPTEAEHDSMPRSTIATGMVDWVLPAAEMPAKLREYWRTEERLRLPDEKGDPLADGEKPSVTPAPALTDEAALHDILGFVRARTGRDFTYYKRATILRRIARRMQVNGIENAPAYLTFLRTHPGETGALLQDLLISVTNFFRDREAFAALEAMIPALFAGKGSHDTVRVWSAACATGEEAYSVAMLLSEYADKIDHPPSIQVFATDLDEQAIRAARDGTYPETISADVSEERLRRFFTHGHGNYRVKRETREIVLFALHDVLRDSPFSRLDLITCRNLLIYFNRDAQERALDIFHFALHPEGVLFLGSSESVDEASALFAVTDKKFRLYSRRTVARPRLPTVFTGPTAQTQAIARHQREGTVLPKAAPVPRGATEVKVADHASFAAADDVSWSEVHAQSIEVFGPPSVIVNREHELVHLSGDAGRYLRFSHGEASSDLLRLVHPMLRIELRAALFRAAQSGEVVETHGVSVEIDGARRLVDLRVAPTLPAAPGFLLVIFAEREAVAELAQPRRIVGGADAEPAMRELERELEQSKNTLRDTVEQADANQEELKASNEELQAMNEELRSTSEELETGREELQSINEELTTVNQEMKSKVDELARSNGDLQNLMAATAIPTVFLDRYLCIQRYTPPAVALFNIIPSDVGRPLSDLTPRVNYPDLAADAERVLEDLAVAEREVFHPDQRFFLARLRPYRVENDRIAGVVLTFVDITDRKRSEEARQRAEDRFALVVQSIRDYAIYMLDAAGIVTTWNEGAEQIKGYRAEEIIGQHFSVCFTPEDRAAGKPQHELEIAVREGHAHDENWRVRKGGELFWGDELIVPLRGDDGKLIAFAKFCRDFSGRKQAEDERVHLLADAQAARAEAEAAGAAKDHFLAVLSHELRTPLTPVLMAAHMLARHPEMPESAQKTLAMIIRNVQVEARFIDELLDLTKISRGKMEILRDTVNLHEAVSRAVEVTSDDVTGKGQHLTVTLEAREHLVQGDATRLQQVFWNLLKNASKFTPEGGSIRVNSRNEPGLVVVEISDTGIGFDPASAARLFEAFSQASQEVTRKFGGLGLGLAIAKATVDTHGGILRASSEGHGQGAAFTVSLPLLS